MRSLRLVFEVDNQRSYVSHAARRAPFELRFLSDQFEFANEAMNVDRGFQLGYILSATNC